MSEWRFAVLGPVEVWRDGRRLPVPAGRRRSVLAALLMRAGEVVDADALIEAAWGEELPVKPRASLHTVVSRLRSLLGDDMVRASAAGYLLEATGDTLDSRRFERLCARAATAGPERAAVLLDEALGLWRGRAYGEFAEDRFAEVEVHRLELLRVDAQQERARIALELDDPEGAVRRLDVLLAEHPFREHAVELLLTALHRAGRTSDALARYQSHRQRMADELGLDPAPALRELQARLLGRPEPAPVRAPPDVAPGWLDTSAAFLGREHELSELVQAVAGSRLVSVVGTGGVGKSRLTAEALPGLGARLRLPVVVVELAGVQRGGVAAALLTGIGVHAVSPAPDLPAVLVDRLRADPAIVVLDNCEHVRTEVTALADLLTRRCSRTRVVLTSRHRLGLATEYVLPLAPLPVPSAAAGPERARDAAAVALLTDRACRARSGFAPGPRELPGLAAICRRLDGLPLALELAASRIAVLGVEAVRESLDRDLGILDQDPTGQRPLQALVDWSCHQLSAEAQDLFAVLSVFCGDFEVAAVRNVAEQLGAASPETVTTTLATLVDSSLVSTRDVTAGPRYRLLAVIRAQAHRRLAESGRTDEARRGHAGWVAAVARQAAADWTGLSAAVVLHRLRHAHDDITAALRWALPAGELDLAAGITGALVRCAHWTPGPELSELIMEVGERQLAQPAPRSPAVAAASVALAGCGSLDRSLELARTASRTASTPIEHYLAQLAVGVARIYRGDHHESRRAWQTISNLAELPLALRTEGHSSLALLARYAGDLDLARQEGRLARMFAEATGSAPVRAFACYAAGEAAVADPDMGAGLLHDAAEEATAIGLPQVSQLARVAQFAALVRTGEHHRASRLAAPLLRDLRRAAAWPQLWTALRVLAELLAATDHPHEAALLLEAAGSHPSAPPTAGEDVPRYRALRGSLAERLGERRVGRIRAAAGSASREQVADWAVATVASAV